MRYYAANPIENTERDIVDEVDACIDTRCLRDWATREDVQQMPEEEFLDAALQWLREHSMVPEA